MFNSLAVWYFTYTTVDLMNLTSTVRMFSSFTLHPTYMNTPTCDLMLLCMRKERYLQFRAQILYLCHPFLLPSSLHSQLSATEYK